ncbi:dihydrofolate reductase family protein [Nonomuraea sp. NPDC050790]|uniref:dihydrofolate reductase family protein n=1 Tax=Nonomuraea sp. NPDC050790 TaxID=3364371 RepID=UPI0037BBC75C
MMTTGQSRRPRTVIADIALSLDGRVTGPGGEYDASWAVPHALTRGARSHTAAVTSPATTALLGRKSYEGYAGYWPADDDNADPDDRTFARWLTDVDKIVFTGTRKQPDWDNTRLATTDPAPSSNSSGTRKAATSSS